MAQSEELVYFQCVQLFVHEVFSFLGSNSYEKVKTLNIFGTLLTNQNSINEETKCRLQAGNSCYYSVQTLLSSKLLSKNLKIKIYKTIILPLVLYSMLRKQGLLLLKGMQAKSILKQDPEANTWAKRDANEWWRRLHNEELHSLYHSPNIVRVMKSRG